MKKFFILSCLLLSASLSMARSEVLDPVRSLLKRVTGKNELPVTLEISGKKAETYYSYEVREGVLRLTASDKVALCRGFYDYLKSSRMGMYAWSGNSISFPDRLQNGASALKKSPFLHHYYFNVVTFGYSMPYWDWSRWEKEIDWMALHGIDMPLALVGYEAILARVWKKFGLTDEEVNSYFVGPAHLPWMRMGNISGVDGPLNEDWHAGQIALQHKILERMKSLGMKPICPGFPGFIPEAFKRLYPALNIVETHWGGAFHNWMISPEEPLFSEIGKTFIKEWEKEFGKNEYYLVDSFNEMDIPFPKKGDPKRYKMAARYGKTMYESIRSANPKAVWVMQGWMFGYQRDIWDYETLGALVSEVPDDKMLLLDLAADYNRLFWGSEFNWEFYKGFYNKSWVYSVIPNMGGKNGMTGVLDFYANGHLAALSSPNRGHLLAHGMAPEGIENNEVLYELVTDAGWSDSHMDVREWLKNYCINRYGKVTDSIMGAWDLLLKSCYGSFTDHPRFNWQFRPGLVKQGSINISPDYFKGLEKFISSADDMGDSPLFKADLIEMTSHYLGGKAEILTGMIDQEYLLGDTLRAEFLQSRFEAVMRGMDALLSRHPLFRLDRWLEFAGNAARTETQAKQYLTNARRIVTVWGPPVDDYSARVWSGLIRNYYLPRWKHYYESRNTGKSFDFPKWELGWVENNTDRALDYGNFDVKSFSKELLEMTKGISDDKIMAKRPGLIGFWSTQKDKRQQVVFALSAKQLKKMHGFTLEVLKGDESLQLLSYRLIADGKEIKKDLKPDLSGGQKTLSVDFSIPEGTTANNGCVLELDIRSDARSAGIVYAQ